MSSNNKKIRPNQNNQPQKPGHQQLQQTAFLQYSSPLPPPEVLEKYNHLGKGIVEKIIDMADNQAAHRQKLEITHSNAQIKQIEDTNKHRERRDWEAKLGQLYAFVISMFAIGSGVYTALQGHEYAATVISAIGLTGLVARFITGRDDKDQDKNNSK